MHAAWTGVTLARSTGSVQANRPRLVPARRASIRVRSSVKWTALNRRHPRLDRVIGETRTTPSGKIALRSRPRVRTPVARPQLNVAGDHDPSRTSRRLPDQDPGADLPSSPASSTNAVSAARIEPSFVANANTVFFAGSSMSSAYHNLLLPLCQSTGPPAQSRS